MLVVLVVSAGTAEEGCAVLRHHSSLPCLPACDHCHLPPCHHLVSATFLPQPISLQGAFSPVYTQLLYLGCGGTLGPQRLSQGYLRRHTGCHFYRTWCPFLAPPSQNGGASLLLSDPHRLSAVFCGPSASPAHLGTMGLSSLRPCQTPSAV